MEKKGREYLNLTKLFELCCSKKDDVLRLVCYLCYKRRGGRRALPASMLIPTDILGRLTPYVDSLLSMYCNLTALKKGRIDTGVFVKKLTQSFQIFKLQGLKVTTGTGDTLTVTVGDKVYVYDMMWNTLQQSTAYILEFAGFIEAVISQSPCEHLEYWRNSITVAQVFMLAVQAEV